MKRARQLTQIWPDKSGETNLTSSPTKPKFTIYTSSVVEGAGGPKHPFTLPDAFEDHLPNTKTRQIRCFRRATTRCPPINKVTELRWKEGSLESGRYQYIIS